MPRTRSVPTNADIYRRCVAELSSVHHVDLVNGGHKKLRVSPERYAELVGTLVFSTAFSRFMLVVGDFLRDGENSELGRLAGLVMPESPEQQSALFGEAEIQETPAKAQRPKAV